jgi:hypothetical protein
MLRLKLLKILLFFMILMLTGCITDGNNPEDDTVMGPDTEVQAYRYDKQVQQYIDGTEKPDLAVLRDEYVTTEYYRPWDTTGVLQQMKTSDEKRDWISVAKLAEQNVSRYFVNIEFHYLAMKANKNLGNNDKYLWHRKMLYDIVQEIMSRGNGKSLETAYRVISVSEEFVIMNFLGLRYSDQLAFPFEGHYYEQFLVEPNEFYNGRQIYFNVDIPMKWLESRKEEK